MSLRDLIMVGYPLQRKPPMTADVIKRWEEVICLRHGHMHHILLHVALTRRWELLRLLNNGGPVDFSIHRYMDRYMIDSSLILGMINSIENGQEVVVIQEQTRTVVEDRGFGAVLMLLLLYHLFTFASQEYQKHVHYYDGAPIDICTSEEFWYNISRYIPHRVSELSRVNLLYNMAKSVGASEVPFCMVSSEMVPLADITIAGVMKIKSLSPIILRWVKEGIYLNHKHRLPPYMSTLFTMVSTWREENGVQLLYNVGYRAHANPDGSYTVTCPPEYGDTIIVKDDDTLEDGDHTIDYIVARGIWLLR